MADILEPHIDLTCCGRRSEDVYFTSDAFGIVASREHATEVNSTLPSSLCHNIVEPYCATTEPSGMYMSPRGAALNPKGYLILHGLVAPGVNNFSHRRTFR